MLGADFLKKLDTLNNVEMVSANIVDQQTGKPIVSPYKLEILKSDSNSSLPFKRLTVGVIGLAEDFGNYQFSNQDNIKLFIKNPAETAKIVVPQMRKKADLIILLYYGQADQLKAVLEAARDIDVVVYGGIYSKPAFANSFDKTIFVTTPSLGKYAGILSIELSDKKEVLSYRNKEVALDESIPDKPEIADFVKEFEKTFDETKGEVLSDKKNN